MNKLCQWTIKWLMFFNIDKCKVMHIGKDNPNFAYEMSDNQGDTKKLISVEYKKDFGIRFQDNLKFVRRISLTVNRANRLGGSSVFRSFPRRLFCFSFFGDFRCGVLLFMVILVMYKYKTGKNSC